MCRWFRSSASASQPGRDKPHLRGHARSSLRNSDLSCLFFPHYSVSLLILRCGRLMGSFLHAALVGWSYIGEVGEQIGVRPPVVFRYLSISEDANKRIERIVSKCPAVIGKTRRMPRLIRHNIWEQCPRHALRLSRRISTCVLQSVCEASKETPIVRRFTCEVGISFFDKHDSLGRPRSALHLNPAAAVTWRKRSRPKAHLSCPQSRIRYFKNDAAYIFVSEEIVARELEAILRAFHVAEKRVAPPAGKEAVVSCLCNPRLALN